jgi:sterol desaturase/sphingolipid hydroxylase (fatty acid hydroxylase superfamily)
MGAVEQIALRLLVFIAVFVALALGEHHRPRGAIERGGRWLTNIGLVVFNTALMRLASFALPALAVAAAFGSEHWQWGLLPLLGLPDAAAFVAGFVVLDLAVYGQHVAMHLVPPLWRMHRVHHADAAFDLTTGLRFHPLEILVSQVWKIAVIVLVGVPALAALAFEIVLNASSMFSHANLRLPAGWDRWLRLAIVTPDMHRVHHSTERDERDSNFGFNLSLWDRLFRTYRAAPRVPLETMAIGIGGVAPEEARNFLRMMRYPFAEGAP